MAVTYFSEDSRNVLFGALDKIFDFGFEND
jgi:hypothetical protein